MVEYIKRNPSNFHIKGEANSSSSVSQLMTKPDEVENIDLKEIHFQSSNRDLTEAKIHHLLTETKSYRKSRKMLLSNTEGSSVSWSSPTQKTDVVLRKRIFKKKKNFASTHNTRVSGSQKQLQDEHIHAVIATEDSNPPAYEDLENVLSFTAAHTDDEQKTYDNHGYEFQLDSFEPTLPWKVSDSQTPDISTPMSDSKDYLFFNRRESKNSLFGDNEEKRTSYQHNDIEFLNALTKRKISTAQPIRKTTTMLSREPESLQDKSRFFFEADH